MQLHCPPPAVYSDQRVYDTLDALVAEEAIAAYGVSVETVAEGLTALQHPGVQTIQVILNIFRRKPLEELLPAAAGARASAILARVPLASGLLTGKYDESTDVPRRRPPELQPATARPSTSGRPSPACRSRSASPPPARSPRSPATPCRPRPSRCAG